MKNKFFYILFIIPLFLLNIKVYANEGINITRDYLPNIYYNQIISGTHHWGQFPMFKADGEVVFCIEPGTPIKSLLYIASSDWSVTALTQDEIDKIELIAYYGYNYPSHQTEKYLMATQKLIWETLGVDEAYFTNENYGHGDIINLKGYITDIEHLIYDNDKRPSFDNKTIKGFLNQTITLSDPGNEVKKYRVFDNDGQEVTIADRQLIIRLTNPSNGKVMLTKTNNIESVIFKNNTSQTLAKLGLTNNQAISEINIDVLMGTINFSFIETDQLVGEATLANAVYEITSSNGFKGQITTSEEGKAVLNNLTSGEYIIRQTKPSEGYLADPETYYAYIDENNLITNILLDREVIQRILIINLFSDNTLTNTCENTTGFTFGIYQADELVNTITINEEGTASILLPFGTYTVKQLNDNLQYSKVEDFIININDDIESGWLINNIICQKVILEDNKISNDVITKPISNNTSNDTTNTNNQNDAIIDFEIPQTSGNNNFIFVIYLLLGLSLGYFGIKNEI